MISIEMLCNLCNSKFAVRWRDMHRWTLVLEALFKTKAKQIFISCRITIFSHLAILYWCCCSLLKICYWQQWQWWCLWHFRHWHLCKLLHFQIHFAFKYFNSSSPPPSHGRHAHSFIVVVHIDLNYRPKRNGKSLN